MSVSVQFIEDSWLPEGVEWAVVRLGEEARLFIKRSAATVQVLLEAWAAYRKVAGLSELRCVA